MASEQPKGNPGEWENIWQDLKAVDAPQNVPQLFVRGRPINLRQLWQRCYFEDLKRCFGKPKDGQRFLELGSGRGTLSMYLASEGATDITMVDLSESAFQLARVNFSREDLPLPNMVLANAESTGLPESSFDCIYNIGLLEHFEDPGRVIRETYRLLKPGGFTFQPIVPALSFKNALLCLALFKPISLPKQIFRLLRSNDRNGLDGGMVRTDVDRATYLSLSKDAGFVDCQCIPYNSYWKVNRDGWFEDRITTRCYALHHAIKRGLSKKGTPLLKTSSALDFCYLLVGRKPYRKSH